MSLLSERELQIVGQTLRRVYRVDDGAQSFDDLLVAIDAADARLRKGEQPRSPDYEA